MNHSYCAKCGHPTQADRQLCKPGRGCRKIGVTTVSPNPTVSPSPARAPVLGWHFLNPNGKIAHYRGSTLGGTVVQVGQELTVTGRIRLCINGLHASVKATDALFHAPGPMCCRVELSGAIHSEPNKLCAQHRKVLALTDATIVLHEWACDLADWTLQQEQAAGREPDACLAPALAAKRRWLTEGKMHPGTPSYEALNTEITAVTKYIRSMTYLAEYATAARTVSCAVGNFTPAKNIAQATLNNAIFYVNYGPRYVAVRQKEAFNEMLETRLFAAMGISA